MYSEERRHEIMTRIQRDGRINSVELAAEFDVTGETLRKDLILLEKLGLLSRTHGGAIAVERGGFEIDSPDPGELYLDEKIDLCRQAAEHLKNKDTVLIGHGTSTRHIPRFIPYDRELRVVTDSIPIQTGLLGHPRVTTMATGGIIRPHAQNYVGPWAIRSLKDIKVDVAVLGVAGVSADQGLTAADALDAEVKEHMVKSAKKLIIVANSAKVGHDHFHRFASLENVDVLIVNKTTPAEHLEPLRERIPIIELV